MEKVRFPRRINIYLPLIAVFAVLFLLLPRSGKFSYDYRKGSPWVYDNLVADFDFPLLKTEEQLQSERESLGAESIPYCRLSSSVAKDVLAKVSALDFAQAPGARTATMEAISELYQRGVLPDALSGSSSGADRLLLIQVEKRVERHSSSEYLSEEESQAFLRDELAKACPQIDADSLLKVLNIYPLLRANLVYDKQATELMHQKSVDYISTTSGIVPAGTVIVRHGETVTAEIKQMLDSYRLEFNSNVSYNGPAALLWLGNALMALFIVLLLFLSICYGNANVLDSYNRYLYLLFIFLLSAVATLLVDRFNPDSIFFIPYSIIAIYLMAFFKKRVVMPAYIMSLIPLLLFTNGGEGLFMMHLVAGMVCIFTFSYFNHGWLQFVNAIFIFISASLVLLTNRLINGDPNLFDYSELLKIFIGSLACWLGYPMIFLFEKLFNLVSNSRLQDLCDTNSKLLQLLAQKAPGTFQHCLQVMNLSDAAARSIGANVLLTRAGALYHDIGKMENPLCFVENQTPGVKYHEELSPEESARDIIKHVSDGVAIADRYRLPDEIKQFIVTHHGTSCAAYFLTKYLNAGGDPDKTDTFYYKGQVPSTKEQSIVMVCDTLEAASRTLTDFSRNAVSDFVDSVFSSKLKEGQFADSALTEREIGIIKSTLKEYIANMHHARIVYPKRKGGSKERF